MNLTPNEAEEELAAIQTMMKKTRHSFAAGGGTIFLMVTGMIWLVGFVATQFLTGSTLTIIWIGASLLGTVLSLLAGARMAPRVRGPAISATAKRAAIFWVMLIFYAIAAVAVAKPTDGKQVTMFVILFTMLGQLSMGLLLSYASVWWALPITALALAGYFLLPGIFYLWMGVLIGGGMIALAATIRRRW